MFSIISKRDTRLILLIFLLSSFSFLSRANCIGVVTAGGGVDFWQHVEDGALQAGKENNYKVIVRGPRDEADVQSQRLIIEQMLTIGCKGIVLAPNSESHIEKVKSLAKIGIPTVFIDRNFDYQDITTVQTNNYSAGAFAAQKLITQLKPNAKIALFRLDKDVDSTSKREEGFLAEIMKSKLQVIVDKYLGTDISEANLSAYQTLSENPNIDGIFTPNESTTLAVLNMRKRLPIKLEVLQIGFDSHPTFKASIESGELFGVIKQKPFLMGYLGIKSIISLLEKEDIPKRIDTPVSFISQQNLEKLDSDKSMQKEW